MARALKIIGIVLGGALAGAIGLSLLICALLWLLMPQTMRNPLGYQMLMLFVTVPLGAVCGAIVSVAAFHEDRS